MPLSAKQMGYLALAWQCFETEPKSFEREKIDYEKFRLLANLASAHSARELMRVTKKKLKEEYGALNGSSTLSTSGSAPSTPAQQGKTNSAAGGDGTPTTKTKGGKKRGASGSTPGSGRGKGNEKKGAVQNGGDSEGDGGEGIEDGDGEGMEGRKTKRVKREFTEEEMEGNGGYEFDVGGEDGADMFPF